MEWNGMVWRIRKVEKKEKKKEWNGMGKMGTPTKGLMLWFD